MPNTSVLIIDDIESNITVLKYLLGKENILVQWLTSTHDLWSRLDTMQKVDVVFLDMKMPKMNGIEVLSIIRSHPNFQKTKVIAYSVHICALETALEMGFDGFLDKPVNARAFPEQLKQILEHSKFSTAL